MAKIYNMGSQDIVYPNYIEKSKSDITGANRINTVITIKGGAGVAFSDKHKVKRNQDFVVTEISSDQLKFLKENKAFMRKVDRGFISIDKAPSELKTDKSAQKTAKDSKRKISTGDVDAE